MVSLTVGYVVLAALGSSFIDATSGLALFWPAAGVAAAWMVVARTYLERNVGLAVVAVTVALSSLRFDSPIGALPISVSAHVLLALVVSVGWQRWARPPAPSGIRLPGTGDLWRLLALCTAAGIITSPLLPVLASLNAVEWHWATAAGWIIRNAVSAFVVGAAILCVLDEVDQVRQARADGEQRATRRLIASDSHRNVGAELVALVLVTAGVLTIVFGGERHPPLSFVVVAVAAWAGFRFSPTVAAAGNVVLGIVAMAATAAGWGPFVLIEDPLMRAATAQLFIGLTTFLALMLALTMAEREALNASLRASERDAREHGDLLAAVTTSMSDGLLVIDAHGRVLLTNVAADRLLGVAKSIAEIPVADGPDGADAGRGFRNLDGSALAPMDRPSARALAGETITALPLRHLDSEGQTRTIAISAAPLAGYRGSGHRAAALVLRDVTEQREQLEELRGFAGVVAHDLKRPLTGVMGWVEVLRDQLEGGDVAAARQTLDRVHAVSVRMQGLIDDLLRYSRAASSNVSLERLDLDELLGEVVDDLSLVADGAQVEHRGLGAVTGDRVLLGQVFANLLGNATTYVAPGVTPRVRVSTQRRGTWVVVKVRDNGIGIPAADLDTVFESFHRAHAETYPGTGLGLAICRRAVERHGGTIRALANPEGGTTIELTLPAVQDGDSATAATPTAGTAGASASSDGSAALAGHPVPG